MECRFRRELNIKQDDLESGEESYVLLNFLDQLIGYLNDTINLIRLTSLRSLHYYRYHQPVLTVAIAY